MRILLLCDQKWRDLPNLCAIKLALESLGDTVLISATKDAYAHTMAFRPDAVVFNHLQSATYRAFSRILKENGRTVVVLPTEGAMRPEYESIGAGEFSDYSNVDLFLAWSNKASDDLRRRWGNSGTEVQSIGCTRFDFHHPRFNEAVTTRDAFCARSGLEPSRPIVTWATAYAYASLNDNAPPNRITQFEKEAAEFGVKECLRRIGIDLVDLPAIVSEGRRLAAEAFFDTAEALPDVQFVIKPHPAEDLSYYKRHIANTGLRNVRLCTQDYIWSILRASDLHLHRQCTTAIEAWMWGKPTIEMGMDNHPARTWPEREAGSDTAVDTKSLIDLVRYRLTSPVDSNLDEYRSNYIHTWFGTTDGHRCEAAAQAIHQHCLGRETASTRQSIRGLGVSHRATAKAVLRRWLNRTASEPLIGRNGSGGIGAEDKLIRRRDIIDYERMLRKKGLVRDRSSTPAIIRGGIALLTRGEALAMAALFGAMSVVGLLEATVVALVVPLVQTIIDPELLNKPGPFAKVAALFGFRWSPDLFPWLAGTVIVLVVVGSVANLAIGWIMDQQAARCRNRLGHQIVCKLVAAPFLWFLSKNTAILARQIFSDIRVWRNDFLQSMMQIAQSIILIVMPAIVVVTLAPSSGLLAILLVGLLGLVMILLVRPRFHSLVRRQKANLDATMRILQQLLTGIREVKVSNRAEFFVGEFDKHHERGNRYFASQRFLSQLSPNLIFMLGQVGFIGTAVLLWSAGLSGAEVTAQLAMLGVVVMRVLPSINKAASHYNTLIWSIPFVEALLVTQNEISEAQRNFGRPPEGSAVPIAWKSIQFEAVSFRYPGAERNSIDGLTVELERGKRYGIVGKSGAGKTTMVNLLLGLLHPTEGRICLDGVPLSSLDLSRWQERIGYVPQDVFLLDDTLRANIAFGDNPANADEKRLRIAVDQAHLTDVVKGLPDGLDTSIGERGRRLSGGQVQRVAIARALYRSPDLVLLDEATSALDSMTEADIQASFDALGEDILAIAVAHRVSSLRNCHSIVVLDCGRVQDIGTYDDLIVRNALFRDLAAQSKRGEMP